MIVSKTVAESKSLLLIPLFSKHCGVAAHSRLRDKSDLPHSCLLRPQHTLSVSSVELAVSSANPHPTLLQHVSKIEVELAFQLELLSPLTGHHFAIASLALLDTKSLALTSFLSFDLL